MPSRQGIRLIAGLLAVAIVATSPFWLFLLTAKRDVKPLPKLVAILPLSDEGNPEGNKTFERIARALAEKVPRPSQLEVVPFEQVRKLGNNGDLRNIGAKLGADYLLLGKMISNGERMYIQLYLVTPQRPSLPSWMNIYELPPDRSKLGAPDVPDSLLEQITRDTRTAALSALR